jgi:hypothetical protein
MRARLAADEESRLKQLEEIAREQAKLEAQLVILTAAKAHVEVV